MQSHAPEMIPVAAMQTANQEASDWIDVSSLSQRLGFGTPVLISAQIWEKLTQNANDERSACWDLLIDARHNIRRPRANQVRYCIFRSNFSPCDLMIQATLDPLLREPELRICELDE